MLASLIALFAVVGALAMSYIDEKHRWVWLFAAGAISLILTSSISIYSRLAENEQVAPLEKTEAITIGFIATLGFVASVLFALYYLYDFITHYKWSRLRW